MPFAKIIRLLITNAQDNSSRKSVSLVREWEPHTSSAAPPTVPAAPPPQRLYFVLAQALPAPAHEIVPATPHASPLRVEHASTSHPPPYAALASTAAPLPAAVAQEHAVVQGAPSPL